MICVYCEKVAKSVKLNHKPREATFDILSETPRCALHWRYQCGICSHFFHHMEVLFSEENDDFFCTNCASEVHYLTDDLNNTTYYARAKHPAHDTWCYSLEHLESQEVHPLQDLSDDEILARTGGQSPQAALSRSPANRMVAPIPRDNAGVKEDWERNADAWDASIGDSGDVTRRYLTDKALLGLLGDVKDAEVIDVGCGNGYFSRRLSGLGARVTGVDVSSKMLEHALRRTEPHRPPITYVCASGTDLPTEYSGKFDLAISNFVLQDIPELVDAVAELSRVLRPDGKALIAVIHPCFFCGPQTWVAEPPDEPRGTALRGLVVDDYFQSRAYTMAWRGFHPTQYFHRTLESYFAAFLGGGLSVDGFYEPTVSNLHPSDTDPLLNAKMARTPTACVFQLRKLGGTI